MKNLICLLTLAGCGFFSQLNAARFEVEYMPTTNRFDIDVCFNHAPPYLSNESDVSQASNVVWDGNGQARKWRSRIYLPQGETGCLRFSQGLVRTDGRLTSARFRQQHPNTRIIKVGDLFWHHPDLPLPKIEISHPVSHQVSAPWRVLEQQPSRTLFQTRPSPRHSDGLIAIGPMQQQTLRLGESKINLSIMPGLFLEKRQTIENWIKTMTFAVAQVADDFPVQEAQVIVIVTDGVGGAVPWGQVNRSGGQGVLFVVNGRSSSEALMADWTAAHEFSHLLMPYTPNDRWLSEGFASYHQNISRLRAGLLDEKTAWKKLLAGFERGRRAAAAHNAPNLKHASMRHLMQMYWGGAVIALKADVALQNQTRGQKKLSLVLNQMQDCCLDTGRGWSASRLFRQLDRISGTQVFSELYRTEVLRQPYPDYRHLLLELGVEQSRYGGIRFNPDAPLAAIRKEIGQQ